MQQQAHYICSACLKQAYGCTAHVGRAINKFNSFCGCLVAVQQMEGLSSLFTYSHLSILCMHSSPESRPEQAYVTEERGIKVHICLATIDQRISIKFLKHASHSSLHFPPPTFPLQWINPFLFCLLHNPFIRSYSINILNLMRLSCGA